MPFDNPFYAFFSISLRLNTTCNRGIVSLTYALCLRCALLSLFMAAPCSLL